MLTRSVAPPFRVKPASLGFAAVEAPKLVRLSFQQLGSTFFLESTYLLVLFIEKVFELCRLKIGYFVVCVTLYLKVSTIKMLPLCCLLAILNYYLIVQFSRCSFLNPSSRIQISTFSVY